MTPVQIAENIRFHTRTDAESFPNNEIILLLRPRMDEIALKILKIDEDYFGTPEVRDIKAGKREYPFPKDMLARMKFLEAKLDGTNWIPLKELDLSQNQRVTDETTILGNFGNTEGQAFFDIFRGSLWLYTGALIDVDEGLKLWTYSYPAYIEDLTATEDISNDPSTIEHGFPREFHELLCIGVRIDYKSSREKPIPLNEQELNYEKKLKEILALMKPMNLDRAFVPTIPSSVSRGDEGYEY